MRQRPSLTSRAGGAASLRSEEGFALVGALLVMVLVTALGGAAIFLSQMDLTLAGNYRAQRTAEAAADSALDLVKAMIYGNVPQLNLPLSIPTGGAAATWQQNAAYSDADIDVTVSLKYKQEDSVNYYNPNPGPPTPLPHPADNVVRYGKDYNYQAAQKDRGKQPVYTATLSDNRTGVKAEADLISAIGFKTPSAIFVKGKIRMEKNLYANEEMIEVTSGAGTPALATTKSKSNANVFIQRAVSISGTGRTRSYSDQDGPVGNYHPDYRAESTLCVITNPGAILNHPTPSTPYCPLTTLDTSTASYAPPKQCWTDLFPRVYSDAEIAADFSAGNCNSARDKMHILLGVGDRWEPSPPNPIETPKDLDAYGNCVAAKAVFNFDVNDTAVVKYNYMMPGSGAIEDMIGATFAELRNLADQIMVGDQTVKDYNCNDLSGGKDLSGMVLGTEGKPEMVFFESNMNDNGASNGHAALALVTSSGPVHGYGILVINGDATIYGSIDWTGLMLVRGKLHFRPWAGGTTDFRSGTELKTHWNGFIMIGGDPAAANDYGLYLWTFAGGSIRLGYSTSEAASIKGIISATVPHKLLAWRRMYN